MISDINPLAPTAINSIDNRPSSSNVNPVTPGQSSNPILQNNARSALQVTVHRDKATKSVSFSLQDQLEIPAQFLETWRRTRGHMSSEAKALARAQHLTRLADNDSIPAWSVGMDILPGFLQPVIQDLTQLRHMQALELLRSANESLVTKATEHSVQGRACRTTLELLYGEDIVGLNRALGKIHTLVNRDRDDCIALLARRRELLTANPIADSLIEENLSTLSVPVLRNRSRSPRSHQQNNPPARGRGRGRGRGYTPSSYSGEVSSNTRQPRSRGTGAPRGRGNSPRGRANSRSRPTQSRARSNSNDRVLQFDRTNNNSRYGNTDRRQRAATNQPRATTSHKDNMQLSTAEIALVKTFRKQ